jgi:glycosyltransferase involved in cell wall biosynthesis
VIAAGKLNEKTREMIDGVKVYRIPVRTTKKLSLENVWFTFRASKLLYSLIIRNEIQLVHVFSYFLAVLLKLWTYPTSMSVKWIYDVRSGPLFGNIFSSFGKKILTIEALFFDKIFIINEMVQNDLFGKNANSDIVVIPSGVDIQRNSPENSRRFLMKYGILTNDIVLVYLGSLNSKRKLQNLIVAFFKALKQIQNLKLIFIGEGEDHFSLNDLTNKLSISNKVFFLGYLDYRDVPMILSAANIAISYVPITPAFDAQPPTKTIEYLSCSLPVIATGTRGNKEIIKHEINGLISKDDPYSLSEEIIRLCLDISLQNKLSTNARASIDKYDWHKIVEEKILPNYLEVLGY